MNGVKSEAVIIGQGRLYLLGDNLYTVFDPVPGCDPDGLDPLDDSDLSGLPEAAEA